MAGHRSAGLARASHVVPVDRRFSGPDRPEREDSLAKILPFPQRDGNGSRRRGAGANGTRGVPAPVRPPLSRVRSGAPNGDLFDATPAGSPDGRPTARAAVTRPPGPSSGRPSAPGAITWPADVDEAKALANRAFAFLTEEIDPRDRVPADEAWQSDGVARPRVDAAVARLPEPLAPAKWAFLGALGLIAAAVASGQA